MIFEELRKLSRPQVAKLIQTVSERNHLLVLTHGNPDPDSIAGAFAMKYLVRQLTKCRARVAYSGIIGRIENKTMVNELNLQMRQMAEMNWRNYDGLALIDHQPRRGMYPWPKHRWPDIIIDHHPRRRMERAATFIDVRNTFGSSSALLASYLLAAEIIPPRWLATALAYGIQTDTQHFSRGSTEYDTQMYLWLFNFIDQKKLYRIANPIKECQYVADHWTGIRNARLWRDVAVSHTLNLMVPDLTAQIADDLMMIRGVRYALTSGYHENTLYFSLRVRHQRRDAGSLMRKLIKRKGSAGGHGFMAGGQIFGIKNEQEARILAETIQMKCIEELYPDSLEQIIPLSIIPESLT